MVDSRRPPSDFPLRWSFTLPRFLFALLFATSLLAQTRPTPGGGGGTGGNTGGGGGAVIPVPPIIGPGTGGGGGFIPGTGGTTDPVPRIVTDPGILTGQTVQASAVIPNPTAASGADSTVAGGATYHWTITGGRILGETTRQTVQYIAENSGTVILNVTVITATSTQSASAQVIALSAKDAGPITAPSSIATNAVTFTASVPPAQGGDRTFRWSVSGSGATVSAGQTAATATIRPGSPGLLEVVCDVTLQRLVTVSLRAFIVVTGNGPPVAVTIANGSGSGTYPAGSRVDILADPPPAGYVFDRWSGDTNVLGTAALAPLLARAAFTVPATPVNLTASYKPAPAWTPATISNFNPIRITPAGSPSTTVRSTLWYHIPAGAQGLVFLLHGAGATGGDWFSRIEELILARDLVAAGYGVAALDSVNRVPGTWSVGAALDDNPDALNHRAAWESFVREGRLDRGSPVFLLGFGDGGDSAARIAELLTAVEPAPAIKGAVLYCTSGGSTLAVTSRVPKFFALAAKDAELGTTGNATARENAQLLAGRGVATGLISNATVPVQLARIRRLAAGSGPFGAEDAESVLAALRAAQVLDPNDYPISAPSAEVVRRALPPAYQSRAAEVAAQVGVAFGARQFYGDANARLLDFLNARAAAATVPAPGRIVNLSTRTRIAYLGDAFTMGFTLTGPDRATVLIRGIGPSLQRFGVPLPLALVRLEVNRGATLLTANEGWDRGANSAQVGAATNAVGAFSLAGGAPDAAVLLALDPGTYTATIKALNGAIGNVLAEVYDVSRNRTRLTNLSTFGKITTDGELLLPGLVISGNNPRTLLLRAIGPSLAAFGMDTEYLVGDPRLTVVGSNGQALATNNNWSQGGAAGQGAMLTAAFPSVGAFPLQSGTSDAALISALTPGNYTLQAGAAPATGTLPTVGTTAAAASAVGFMLLEVYEVP